MNEALLCPGLVLSGHVVRSQREAHRESPAVNDSPASGSARLWIIQKYNID